MAQDLSLKDPITANGLFTVDVPRTGWYRVQIGKKGDDFGSGTVKVRQDGHTYTDLSAVTALGTVKSCCLRQGKLDVVMTGATSPSVHILIDWSVNG